MEKLQKVAPAVAADGRTRTGEVVSAGGGLYQRSHSIDSDEYFECYDEY